MKKFISGGPNWDDLERLENRIAKIERELRLLGVAGPAARPAPAAPPWLDVEAHLVEVPGQEPKRLTQHEFRFLEILVSKAGRWLTTAEISFHVWEKGHFPNDIFHSVRNLAWVTRKTIVDTGYVIDNSSGGRYRLRELGGDEESITPATRAGVCA